MPRIQIRFNTKYAEAPSQNLKWRVVVDGAENLASEVRCEVPTRTTEDLIATGETKWHLSCEGVPLWEDTRVVIHGF